MCIRDRWKRVREFNPEALLQESSDLVQWPIKLYKAPMLSPYYHHGHLLIAADCSAFSYPGFHDALSKGRVPLICCPENDFDITVKLADIFSLNDVASVTIVTMDKPCSGINITIVPATTIVRPTPDFRVSFSWNTK